MIGAAELVTRLLGLGVSDVSGVPCSYLTPVINQVIADRRVSYLPVSQEGEAISIAAGCWLGGGLGCAIAQNSGLGNMVGPLTSLLYPARIPAVLVVTWRGQPGRPDEAQHTLMGQITPALLELLSVGHALLPDGAEDLTAVFDRARTHLQVQSRPWTFVLAQDTVAPEPLVQPDPVQRIGVLHRPTGLAGPQYGRPSRQAALEQILATVPDRAAIVSTTGWTSRELFSLADRPQHFYLVGAMGSAATVGLGVALHTDRPVVVIDGDGALLMRLGSLAAVGAAAPPGYIHVVLDNGRHDSTGGQYSLSPYVDLPGIAAACGYAQVHACGDLAGFSAALDAGLAGGGPSLIHLRIRPGRMNVLGRPTIGPADVARRFREFVTAGSLAQAGSR